jgi:hypothetical protein
MSLFAEKNSSARARTLRQSLTTGKREVNLFLGSRARVVKAMQAEVYMFWFQSGPSLRAGAWVLKFIVVYV